MIDLKGTFKKYRDEHCNFDAVENKLSRRSDLCAFLLLDRLLPVDNRYMILAAEHDEIRLSPDTFKLEAVATEEDILTLVRCGVRYDADNDCLAMFV